MHVHDTNLKELPNPAMYFSTLKKRLLDKYKNEEVCDEAAYLAIFKAYEKQDTFDQSKGGYFAWLFKIGCNCCLDLLRKRARERPLRKKRFDFENSYIYNPEHFTEVNQKWDLIQGAVSALSDIEQRVFALRFLQGYSNKEISKISHLPPNTIASIIHRVKKKIIRSLPKDV